MKKKIQGTMTPPKLNNSTPKDTNDSEVDEIPEDFSHIWNLYLKRIAKDMGIKQRLQKISGKGEGERRV
jgi:hypothetical protein